MPPTTATPRIDSCAQCHTLAHSGLYATPTSTPRYLCFDCLDRLYPQVIDRYDGWRDREDLHAKRAKIARASHREEK